MLVGGGRPKIVPQKRGEKRRGKKEYSEEKIMATPF